MDHLNLVDVVVGVGLDEWEVLILSFIIQTSPVNWHWDELSCLGVPNLHHTIVGVEYPSVGMEHYVGSEFLINGCCCCCLVALLS